MGSWGFIKCIKRLKWVQMAVDSHNYVVNSYLAHHYRGLHLFAFFSFLFHFLDILCRIYVYIKLCESKGIIHKMYNFAYWSSNIQYCLCWYFTVWLSSLISKATLVDQLWVVINVAMLVNQHEASLIQKEHPGPVWKFMGNHLHLDIYSNRHFHLK